MSVTNEMLAAAIDEFSARPYSPFEDRMRAALDAAARAAWRSMRTAPEDHPILVWCPPRDGLPEMYAVCQWHVSAGFCVDEIREPALWCECGALPGE